MTKRERTKLIKKARDLMSEALEMLTEANEAEQESLDNWAENLQESDRYYAAQERADAIDNVQSDLERLIEIVNDVIEDNL